jgi:hypothetical protein
MSSFSTLEASLRTLQAIAESYRGQMTPLVEQELLIILAKALAHKSHGAREAAFYLAAALATCIAGKTINPSNIKTYFAVKLRVKIKNSFYLSGNVKNL